MHMPNLTNDLHCMCEMSSAKSKQVAWATDSIQESGIVADAAVVADLVLVMPST